MNGSPEDFKRQGLLQDNDYVSSLNCPQVSFHLFLCLRSLRNGAIKQILSIYYN